MMDVLNDILSEGSIIMFIEKFPSLPSRGCYVALCFLFDFVWHSHSDGVASMETILSGTGECVSNGS